MIEDIDSLNSNKYTAATWNVLEKVNIEAKKLLKNADSQKNVNETIKKLADLKNSLKLKSSSKDILKFEIKNQIGDTKINKNKNTISIIMPNKTDITKLTPTINVSEGASISPKSGESVDFSKPITYTVTAENGNIKKYTVTVRVKKSAEDNNNSSFKDDSEEANKNSHSIKTPNTSDYNNISLLYGLLIVSVLGISITFKKVFK